MDRRSAGIGVLVIVLLTAGAYTFQKVSNPNSQVLPDQQTGAQTSASDNKMADWKTYSNSRYGYTIKYPETWFVESEKAENDFVKGIDGRYDSGGNNGWSNYLQDPSATETPEDFQHINLTISRTDESLSDFFDNYYKNPDIKAADKIATKIQGKGTIRYSFMDELTSGSMAFVKLSDNSIMVFGTTADSSAVLDVMLSTLEFAK
jgi:hypothetical protein